MTFISALKELWSRKLLVALSLVLALAASLVAMYHVDPSGPTLTKRESREARGGSEVLVDSARSPIAGSKRDITGLIVRAGVFARLMAGGDIVKQIAEKAGVPVEEIDVAGPEAHPEEAPGNEGALETRPYGLAFTELSELPIITVQTRAPTTDEARALAAAAPEALRGLIQEVQEKQETPAKEKVELRVLGPAEAEMFSEGPGKKIGAVVFIAILGIGLGLILAIPRLIAAWKRHDSDEEWLAMAPDISEVGETGSHLVIPNGNHVNVNGESRDDRPRRVRQRQR
ncbi:MAG TPA: hypothetical protein VGC32_04275 [Solirubrobacterales bacterium]